MPVPRAFPRAALFARFLGTAVVASIALFCMLLLAVRFIVLPQVDSQRGEIAAWLSKQLGGPVEIGELETGWDGWNPKLVVSGFRILDRTGASAQPLLELPRVEMLASWTSVLALDLRLRELSIERPRLAIRRDRAGRFHVGGLEIDPDSGTDDRPFTDWLLRQRSIVIKDALITWNDDRRNAPQLVLDRVQLRLENSLGHHRFGITGVPPPELASPLDLRGDLTGGALGDWQQADGQIYVRLDYADVAAWREWIPLPIPVDHGKGAMRMWFRFAGGVAQDVTSDIELADVRLRFEEDLPPLELTHLAGRIAWQQQSGRRELSTRDLAFVARDGLALKPTDLKLALTEGPDGTIVGGTLAFDQVELAPLAEVGRHVPLPAAWRHELARYLPRGTVTKGKYTWSGPTDAPEKFTAHAEFSDLGLVAQGALPGAVGITGDFDATERNGRIKVGSRAATVELPRVFTEPLTFERLDAVVRWERRPDGVEVRIDELAFANADATGSASGTWTESAGGPGRVDLKAQVARIDVQALDRYVPFVLNKGVREWLRTSIKQGTLSDGRVTLAGNLAEFPFGKGRRGTFIAAFKAQGLTVDFAEHWPQLTQVDGEFRFEGTRATIRTRARILDAELSPLNIDVADLAVAHPTLVASGEVTAATSTFLRFIEQSPIIDWIGRFTEGAQSAGTGHLTWRLDLPLGTGGEAAKVSGDYAFTGNELKLPGVPALRQLNGKFAFTDRGLTAHDVALELLGGPAKMSVVSEGGRVRVNASGNASLAQLRGDYPAMFTDRIGGTTDWTLALAVRPDLSTWTVEAPLKGATIDLPAPVGKTAAETRPLRIERRDIGGASGQDTLVVDLQGAGKLSLQRKLGPKGATVERAQLLLGRATEKPGDADRQGLWVRADVASLNIDDWLAVRASEEARGGSGDQPGPALNGVDLEAASLQAIGRRFHDLKIVARRASDAWRLTLAGKEVDGTASWYSPGGEHPNGRIVARLKRLTMPGPGELVPWHSANESEARAQAGANSWPGLDITADMFESKGRDLGRLDVAAKPSGTDWHLDRLALTSDAGGIVADGVWSAGGKVQQTKLDVKVDAQDAGALLARFGFPGTIRGAPTRIDGQLMWAGGPGEFDYPSLSGNFRIQSGAGQFIKIDPGVGKLLGVLSLQALPRRIALDFRDVFSEGFAFDEITGNVRIANGVMHSDGLKISGPAAGVLISGEADIARETQQLNVRVQPSLATSFSAGTAGAAMLLLAANPILAAAIGAGTLLAQKIMADPIDQLFSYDYRITGSWTDPVVTRLATRPATTANAPPESVTK